MLVQIIRHKMNGHLGTLQKCPYDLLIKSKVTILDNLTLEMVASFREFSTPIFESGLVSSASKSCSTNAEGDSSVSGTECRRSLTNTESMMTTSEVRTKAIPAT